MSKRLAVLTARLERVESLLREGEQRLNWLLSQGCTQQAEGVFNDLLRLEQVHSRTTNQLGK